MFYGKCTREKVIMTPKWVSEAMITSPATDQLWSHLCGSLLPPPTLHCQLSVFSSSSVLCVIHTVVSDSL